MKKRKVIVLSSLIVCLMGCGNNAGNLKPLKTMEENNSVASQAESVVEQSTNEIADEQTAENKHEAEENQQNKLNHYSDGLIEFNYPEQWKIKKVNGEDGENIHLYDTSEEGKEILRLNKGEDWRVDLEATEEYYNFNCSDSYNGFNITSLEDAIIDGCKAKKLEFTYIEDDKEFTEIQYMTISDGLSYECVCICLTEQLKECESQINEVMESFKFVD